MLPCGVAPVGDDDRARETDHKEQLHTAQPPVVSIAEKREVRKTVRYGSGKSDKREDLHGTSKLNEQSQSRLGRTQCQRPLIVTSQDRADGPKYQCQRKDQRGKTQR